MINALMVVLVLIVGGAMVGVLTWFFRRLRRIEEESWGTHSHDSLRLHVRVLLGRIQSLVRNRQPRLPHN
ncbi:MAG: hypothetical protein O3B24_04415 [Verrucomicrobia bacterium]|nr:hypothetical protein [Verrucomicrobiota bacterium]